MSEKTLLEHALYWAKEGFPVVPIPPGEKACKLPRWQKEATTNEFQIKKWWGINPDFNFGLLGTDKIIIDVDVRKNGHASLLELQLQNDSLPETLTFQTPTGGNHFIFKASKKFAKKPALRPGIDIIAENSYVVGPGSKRADCENRAYLVSTQAPIAQAPLWLEALLSAPKPDIFHEFDRSKCNDSPENIEAAISYLTRLPGAITGEHGSLKTWQVGADLARFSLSPHKALELFLEHYNPKCEPPWSLEDAKTQIKNGFQGHHYPPFTNTFTEIAEESLTEEVESPNPPLPKTVKKTPEKRFDRMSAHTASFRSKNNWLVKGLIPETGVGVLYGPSGVGKTFVEIDLAFAVAQGIPFHGKRTKQGASVIIALEGKYGLEHRMVAYKKAHSLFEASPPLYAYMISFSFLSQPELLKKLVAQIQEEVPDVKLIMIDTYARAISEGNENEARDVSCMVKAAHWIADQFGAFCCYVHHTGKDKNRGMRGHSSLLAAMDTVIEITSDKQIRIEKQKDGPLGVVSKFLLEPVELGIDEDGDPVTSCVVRLDTGFTEALDPQPEPKAVVASSPAVIKPMETFGLDLTSREGKALWAFKSIKSAHPGTLGVPEDEWRDKLRELFPSLVDNAWRQTLLRIKTRCEEIGFEFKKEFIYPPESDARK